MNNWNSRVSLSLLVALCGVVISHAPVSIDIISIINGHSTFSLIAIFIGIIFIIVGWLRIFMKSPFGKDKIRILP